MVCKIDVIDSIMGSGKTSWAIQNITMYNRHEKFLYITPYLDEVDRVVSSCKNSKIQVSTPNVVVGKGSKSEHFKQLMNQGKNIVTTHSLFDRIDEECLDIIRTQGYTLYMDEVHEVIKRFTVSDDDLKMLIESKYIKIGDKGKVTWIEDSYTGRFEEFKNLCNLGSMYKYSNLLYVWCFPISVFDVMNHIYILTYYFKGQTQGYYYQLHGMEFRMKEVYGFGDNLYGIRDYDAQKAHKDAKKYSELITVYDGVMNYEG
ncbi:MAG: hypothetical protein ACRC0G_03390, partial [Fusobacteriaceae bacterium]